jgi:hypothetical protein
MTVTNNKDYGAFSGKMNKYCEHLYPPGPLPGIIPTGCSLCGKREQLHTPPAQDTEEWEKRFFKEITKPFPINEYKD